MGDLKTLPALYALTRLFGGHRAVVLIPDTVLVLVVAALLVELEGDDPAREGFIAVGYVL
jgi:hypothetical protein